MPDDEDRDSEEQLGDVVTRFKRKLRIEELSGDKVKAIDLVRE
jgi:hypothetical protein